MAQIYRHFAKNGELLYVGMSLSALNRLSQHRDISHWYSEIAQVTVEQFPTRELAAAAEKSAIRLEKPKHNSTFNTAKLAANPSTMSPEQYRKTIKALGLTQQAAANFLDISLRTSQGYALGENPVPLATAKLLRIMVDRAIAPAELE